MRALIRAEIVKLATTRAFFGLVIGAAAVAALGAFSTITSGGNEALRGNLHEQSYFMLASINLALFAVVVGVRGVTDEFRYGSIVPTLLVAPARAKVLVAKLVTFAGAGAVLAVVAQATMVYLAVILITAKGAWASSFQGSLGEAELGAVDVAAMGGLVAASALWAAIGVALGTIVRHQVAAVVGVLVWVLVVENLGAGLLGEAAGYLPGQAGHALALASQGGAFLAPATAGIVLVAYTVVVSITATVRIAHADIVGG